MLPPLGGEAHQIAAVETDAVIMHQIGILLAVHAAGGEPDHALLLVDAVDAAHIPLARGYLPLHLARRHVVKIDMVVVVALARPQQFPAAVDKTTPQTAVIHEFVTRLLHHGAHRARRSRVLQQAVNLVAALVVFEVDLVAVVAQPIGAAQIILARE